MKKKADRIIPEQVIGKTTNASASVGCKSRNEAVSLFKLARSRLLDIDNWHAFSGNRMVSAVFKHTDENGESVKRLPTPGDYIRIDLPGPGPSVGDGYDWVRIESIDYAPAPDQAEEYCTMRVRPATNPAGNSEDIAHFYTDTATSSFLLQRIDKTVIAEEQGKNEIPNNENNEKLIDKARNTMYAESASRGMAWPQWKMLMEGILNTDSQK